MRPTSLLAAVLLFLSASLAWGGVTYQRVVLNGDPVNDAAGDALHDGVGKSGTK
jgi:hypothetical protein